MLINQANLAALFTGFKANFQQGLGSAPSVYQRIATVVPSSTRQENYGWLGAWPKLREWLGDRQVQSLATSTYTLVNKKYETTVEVPRDDLDDDTYGIYGPMMTALGQAVAVFPDELVFGLLANAFTTTCYDGQPMCSTAHPTGELAAQSNSGGGSGAPWFLMNTKSALKPLLFQTRRAFVLKAMQDLNDSKVWTTDKFEFGADGRCNVGFGFWQMIYGSQQALDSAAFNAGMASMMGLTDEKGRKLGLQPDLLVCGTSNRATALAIIEAQQGASGASNTNYKAVDLLVTPYLA